ncbi:MAG: hypothetical protein ACI8WB_003210 [Phenylobacterium sp.]|jgi:hypothetical protein
MKTSLGANTNHKPAISDIAQYLFCWVAQWCCGRGKELPQAMTQWSPREWKIAKAVLIVHGMGPVLGYLLKQQGDHPALPQDIQAYLRGQFEENSKRIEMISQSKRQISELLQRHHIAFVDFKGLTLSSQLYADIGIRPMADIDIYTGQHHKDQLSEIMAQLNYQPHVITPEGMTLYPHNPSQTNTELQNVNWHGANVSAEDDSLWYQGESTKLPFSIDIHFSMSQGIQEFRYDLEPMFQQALNSGRGLTPEQSYIHLLLHASKHFRCHCARWIQLYDLYLLQQKISIDQAQVLAEAKKHHFCHLLLWPLQLTRKIFATQPTWLEQQLVEQTSRRFRWLLARHELASLSHCNPKEMGLLYALLWTQDLSKIRQWLQLSSHSSDTDFKRDNSRLNRSPPMVKRMINRVRRHFSANTRQQWHIFALQGLAPHKDWD